MDQKDLKYFKQATREFKKQFIIRSVKKYNGNVSLTSKKLGMTRNTLIINIEQLGIYKQIKDLSKNRIKRARKEIALHMKMYDKNRMIEAANKFQRAYMIKTLKAVKGNEAKAALLTGVHRNTIINKVRGLGLKGYLSNLRVDRKKAKAISR